MFELRNHSRSLLLLVFGLMTCGLASAQERPAPQQGPFRGGLNQVQDADRPHPVRNDVAQSGEEIVTLRYFRIRRARSMNS